jgi:hypothetical protein
MILYSSSSAPPPLPLRNFHCLIFGSTGESTTTVLSRSVSVNPLDPAT